MLSFVCSIELIGAGISSATGTLRFDLFSVFGDVGVTIIAVLNAMRILKK